MNSSEPNFEHRIQQRLDEFTSARSAGDIRPLLAFLEGWEEPEREALFSVLVQRELSFQAPDPSQAREWLEQEFPEYSEAITRALAVQQGTMLDDVTVRPDNQTLPNEPGSPRNEPGTLVEPEVDASHGADQGEPPASTESSGEITPDTTTYGRDTIDVKAENGPPSLESPSLESPSLESPSLESPSPGPPTEDADRVTLGPDTMGPGSQTMGPETIGPEGLDETDLAIDPTVQNAQTLGPDDVEEVSAVELVEDSIAGETIVQAEATKVVPKPEPPDSQAGSDATPPGDERLPKTTIFKDDSQTQEKPRQRPKKERKRSFSPSESRSRIPQAIGRYKIQEVLGKGGMGVVYLALDPNLDRRVALKVPSMAAINDTDGLNRFLREAKSLAAIVHPNICPIHEVATADSVHFITMTYVEGRPLSSYISKDDPIDIKEAIIVIRKLASALQHAHDAGVIHRDLKPSNVIINNLNEPVIIDFGLARRTDTPDLQLTQAGQIMGTPAYMPPEQFTNELIGPACDIYSLGVILYELLTGTKPFTGSFPAIVLKIDAEVAELPSKRRSEIDSDLDAICSKCLEKSPEDRFGSMKDFGAVLSAYLDKDAKASDPSDTTQHPVRPGGSGTRDFQTAVTMADYRAPADRTGAVADPGDETVVPVSEGYRLTERIGKGAYGEVWKAIAPGGVEVAVKKILFPVGHNATQFELRALELMKRLRHSFLVQVQAYWIMQEQLMIVMELADGSLDERAKECKRESDSGIPHEELLNYMREAAEAIDFLHGENVLHRDIKPANILLVKGHVKVADFGIAMTGVLGEDRTTAATTLGTPRYMAPELWKKRAGPASDQYSLAVSYYELRAGVEPKFSRDRKLDVSGVREAEAAVIQRAIAPDPKERFESCKEFVDALYELIAEKRRAEERKRRRKQLRIAGIVATVILLPLSWWVWNLPVWEQSLPDLAAPDLIQVRAGGSGSTVSVATVGTWDSEPLDLTLDRIPPGVEFSWEPIEGGAEVRLQAALQTTPSEVEVTLVAKRGDTTVEHPLTLAIEEAQFELPPGCHPAANAQLLAVADKVYYDRIEYRLPDLPPVEFLLIPRNEGADPATFYVMRDKVSNRMFQSFVAAQADRTFDEGWKRGARAGTEWLEAEQHPELPVLGVRVVDAHEFAQWMGGKLPTIQQWDKAAGRNDHADDQEGPFRGTWEAGSNALAIGRTDGPFPVGTADQDVSPFGCRDMAGNGREWTRSIHLSQREVPQEQPGQLDLVVTRGRAYDHPEPLRYADLGDEDQLEASLYSETSPHIGFRCVIEMSD